MTRLDREETISRKQRADWKEPRTQADESLVRKPREETETTGAQSESVAKTAVGTTKPTNKTEMQRPKTEVGNINLCADGSKLRLYVSRSSRGPQRNLKATRPERSNRCCRVDMTTAGDSSRSHADPSRNRKAKTVSVLPQTLRTLRSFACTLRHLLVPSTSTVQEPSVLVHHVATCASFL